MNGEMLSEGLNSDEEMSDEGAPPQPDACIYLLQTWLSTRLPLRVFLFNTTLTKSILQRQYNRASWDLHGATTWLAASTPLTPGRPGSVQKQQSSQ